MTSLTLYPSRRAATSAKKLSPDLTSQVLSEEEFFPLKSTRSIILLKPGWKKSKRDVNSLMKIKKRLARYCAMKKESLDWRWHPTWATFLKNSQQLRLIKFLIAKWHSNPWWVSEYLPRLRESCTALSSTSYKNTSPIPDPNKKPYKNSIFD